MKEERDIFTDLIHNQQESGWDFGTGDPEFWKFSERLLVKSGKALDVGAGFGRSSLFFALQGMEVTAVEKSCELVGLLEEMAEKRNLPINVQKGDFNQTQLRKGYYDTVILDRVLSHTSSRREAYGILDGALASTKDGGHLWVRAVGVEDSEYEKFSFINNYYASGGDIVRRVEDGVYFVSCSCHGVLHEDYRTFFGQTELLEYFCKKGLKMVYSRVAPQDYTPNIMYGEDWETPRGVNAEITHLVQKDHKF